MSVYSCSIKIFASGFDKLLKSIYFLPPGGCGSVFPAESCWHAWGSGRGWWGLCDVWSGAALEENWALSVTSAGCRHCQFLVQLIDFLSIHLRCNGFSGIQKAIVDQTGSGPPKSDHDLFFFLCKFGFGKCFGASSWSNHWTCPYRLLYKIHFSSQVTIWLRNGSLLLHRICYVMLSCLVVSDSLRPHGQQPAKILCPWWFFRQEDWSGLPCPPPENLPNPGMEPWSPTLQTVV